MLSCNIKANRRVVIATGYGLDDRGVGSSSPGRDKKFLPLLHGLQTGSGGPPSLLSIQRVPGALTLQVQRSDREAHHLPPT
jgi:hypothetical protein